MKKLALAVLFLSGCAGVQHPELLAGWLHSQCMNNSVGIGGRVDYVQEDVCNRDVAEYCLAHGLPKACGNTQWEK